MRHRLPGVDLREALDLETLDMNREDRCVLGQLAARITGSVTAGYYTVLDHWELSNEEAARLGFYLTGNESFSFESYATLTREWREALST